MPVLTRQTFLDETRCTAVIGTSLNHYQITGQLGVGGMGEVYRARDTRLGREVAIKVLPATLEQDRQYVSRFKREARLLASLNHPHIASIYGFEEHGGKHFLVLELVDGETLDQRLRRGPLSVAETLEACQQIALAIQAAHEKDIIHRDLKPANIKFTSDGKVKVLDFGLAKALSQASVWGEDTVKTVSMIGVVLGTPSYMSPEQASGTAADKQTDIWIFGCLLYECLTGKRLFGGKTLNQCLNAVLKMDPDWAQLPKETPHALKQLLRKCLQRDPRQRLAAVGEAVVELENALTELRTGRPVEQPAASKRARLAALAVAGLLVLIAVCWWMWVHRAPSSTKGTGRVPQISN